MDDDDDDDYDDTIMITTYANVELSLYITLGMRRQCRDMVLRDEHVARDGVPSTESDLGLDLGHSRAHDL
jgi:hypothetical protein